MRMYLQKLLAAHYDIDTVSNGVEALRAIRLRLPDLVVSDVMMPEMDGFALLAELRKDKRTGQLPVLLLSARAGEEACVEGIEAGAVDYLVKPFTAREFLTRVRSHIELAQFRQKLAKESESLREAVRSLASSEERFQFAIRGTNDGVWDWNLETGELYLSPRCKEMLGYSDDEFPSEVNFWRDRIHLEDRQRSLDEMTAHLEGRLPFYQNERRMLHKDGVYRWILSRGVCIRAGNGKAVRMAGSHADISDRKPTPQPKSPRLVTAGFPYDGRTKGYGRTKAVPEITTREDGSFIQKVLDRE